MGQETSRNPCCDSAIIGVGSNEGHIHDKGYNSSVGESVIGPLTSVPGTYVYTEGATSGVRGNIDVLETGQVVTFTDPDSNAKFTAENEALGLEKTVGAEAVAGGDSGGPVIVNSSTRGRVYGTGTTSGGYGNVSYPSTNDQGVVPHCYGEIWFEEMIPILNLWGVNLVTS